MKERNAEEGGSESIVVRGKETRLLITPSPLRTIIIHICMLFCGVYPLYQSFFYEKTPPILWLLPVPIIEKAPPQITKTTTMMDEATSTTSTATTRIGQEQIPYWIPQDVLLRSKKKKKKKKKMMMMKKKHHSASSCYSNRYHGNKSSSNSSCSSRHDDDPTPPDNNIGNDIISINYCHQNLDHDDDASSVGSTSTTSDLTTHSCHDARIHTERSIPTLHNDKVDIQWAVEATYHDLERIETWSSNPVVAEAAVPTLSPRTTIIDDNTPVATEEALLFDPFWLHSNSEANASFTFTEYYSHMEEIQDEDKKYLSQQQLEQQQQQGEDDDDDLLTTAWDNQSWVPVLPTNKEQSPSTVSRRRRMMLHLQRCHNDVVVDTTTTSTAATTATTTRQRKSPRGCFVPFRTRMERLQHQSQKPFRTVSRAVFGSVAKLHHRVTRPSKRCVGTDPDLLPHHPSTLHNINQHQSSSKHHDNIKTSRTNVFRPNNGNNLFSCEYQWEEEDSVISSSSLPELRNVDSEETGQTLSLDRSSQTMAIEGNENEDEMQYPVQLLLVEPVTPPPRTTLFKTTWTQPEPTIWETNDENGDLRWLFARQQWPLDTPVYPSNNEERPQIQWM
jgi:hypothetical protein